MSIQITTGELRRLTRRERRQRKTSYKWVVETPFTFTKTDTVRPRRPSQHVHVHVSSGFLTDGASGCGPDLGSSWVFHDWLYATHQFTSGQPCSRAEADHVMDLVLQHERLRFYAWTFRHLARWNPARAFARAWQKSGARGPQFLHQGDDGTVSVSPLPLS